MVLVLTVTDERSWLSWIYEVEFSNRKCLMIDSTRGRPVTCLLLGCLMLDVGCWFNVYICLVSFMLS